MYLGDLGTELPQFSPECSLELADLTLELLNVAPDDLGVLPQHPDFLLDADNVAIGGQLIS